MAIKTKRFLSSRKSCSCSMPGVWRAVAYMDGVVVVFHSPRACAHVARTMDINSQYRTLSEGRREDRASVPLLCSQMAEKDSIFGGVERLTKCVRFAMESYKPECLVIANSCVAGVIGDDVDAAAREAEAEYGVPVLTVDCCGFLDGEYYQGYFEITKQLMERFIKPCAKEAGTALLIGDNGGPWGHYALEVTRLLAGLGVRVIGQFPGYVPFKQLPQLAAAEIAMVLGGRGQTYDGLKEFTQEMSARFDMKFLPDVYPVGWQQTHAWLLAVGELVGCREQAEAVWRQEEARLQAELQRMLPVTSGRKTVLCIGRLVQYFRPEAILETIKMLELDLTGVIVLDCYMGKEREEMVQLVKDSCDYPVYDIHDGEALLHEAELVLTTHELQVRDAKQIFLPMLPLVALTGELKMMRGIYQSLCSRLKGGMLYV